MRFIANDLSSVQEAGAIKAPAVQDWYAAFVARYYNRALRVPGIVGRDLDFIGTHTALFRLGTVLASAAFFGPDFRGRCMVRSRDRADGARVIMDSGGYSIIAKDRLPDPTWVELAQIAQDDHADIAITPDAPTRSVDLGKNRDLDGFNKCLSHTLAWLRTYVRRWNRSVRRPLILNALQGRDEVEWQTWFEAVTRFQPEFSGFAFAGEMRNRWSFVLDRLLWMLQNKWLDDVSWLHWLGLGSPNASVILTAVRDGLRQATGNARLQVSFDDSMAEVAHSRGWKSPLVPVLSSKRVAIESILPPNDARYVGSDLLFSPGCSPLVQRGMTLGHICHRRSGPTTWDAQSQCLLANHVTYVRGQALGQIAVASRYPRELAYTLLERRLVELREVIMAVIVNGDGKLLSEWRERLDRAGRDDD